MCQLIQTSRRSVCCQLLKNAEVKIAVTRPSLDESLSWPSDIKRLCIDKTTEKYDADGPLAPLQTPGDLAYVIYTSGSTGLPKGVMIDHRGAVITILDMNERFNVSTRDKVLALSSLSFDLSVYDVFGMLAAGGAIVIPEAWASRDPGPLGGVDTKGIGNNLELRASSHGNVCGVCFRTHRKTATVLAPGFVERRLDSLGFA